MPKWILSAIISVGIILGQTGQNVCLPVFADNIGGAGGTPYFVVWFSSLAFVILFGAIIVLMWLLGMLTNSDAAMLSFRKQAGPLQIGLADALNGMMVVFASPSSRTPPYLQAILGNLMIPLTILIRTWYVRKVPTLKQGLAALLVLGGLFLSLYPTLAGGDSHTQPNMLWPLWFMAGFIPAAFMNVVEEDVLSEEHRGVNMIIFVFSLNFWQLVFVTCFFWVDVIPHYGMSSDLNSWAQHMQNGFECFFFSSSCGGHAFGWGMAFILFYMLSYVASGLLLKFSQDALWQVLVTTIVSPIATLWFTVFQLNPHFHFEPKWTEGTTFAMLGLMIIVPGIFVYKQSEFDEVAEVAESTHGESFTQNSQKHVKSSFREGLPRVGGRQLLSTHNLSLKKSRELRRVRSASFAHNLQLGDSYDFSNQQNHSFP